MNRCRFTVLALLATAGTAGAAGAQTVSMADAIGIAREIVPDRTLVQIDLRDLEDEPLWQASFVDDMLIDEQEVEIDATTGKVLGTEIDAIDPEDLPVYEAIFADPEAIAIGFLDALDIAGELVGEGVVAWNGELEFEAGVLAYQIEYSDETKIYVDANNGAIVNEHGDDEGDDDVLPPDQLAAGIEAAVALNGLPVLEAEGEDEFGGDDNVASVVEVVQWDGKNGMLVHSAFDATTLELIETVSYTPSDAQLERLQPVIDALDSITTTFAGAMAEALAAQPDAIGVHEISLKAEDLGIFYEVELVNAMGFEIDVLVDAFGKGPAASYAGVNFHPCDYNVDGLVDANDLAELLSVWGTLNPGYDLDGDLAPGGAELGTLLVGWN
jgi:uncharacterized membrane protein YkoI